MKKLLPILLILAVSALAISCKKSPASSSVEGKKYEIKAGTFTYTMTLPGFGPVDTVTYFDDFGAKECTESKSELSMFGQTIKQHSRTVIKDGYSYTLDMIQKTGTKTKLDAMMSGDMKLGFAAMANSMKDSVEIKELGTEEFLGKECRKVQMKLKDGSSNGTYWLWKNISLKMESQDPESKQKFVFAASKVEELANVAADMFEIPADFKITEMKMPKMDAGE